MAAWSRYDMAIRYGQVAKCHLMKIPDHLDTEIRLLRHFEIVLNESCRLILTESINLKTSIEEAQHVGIR